MHQTRLFHRVLVASFHCLWSLTLAPGPFLCLVEALESSFDPHLLSDNSCAEARGLIYLLWVSDASHKAHILWETELRRLTGVFSFISGLWECWTSPTFDSGRTNMILTLFLKHDFQRKNISLRRQKV